MELELNMISRVTIADANGDGRPDILFTVEDVDYKTRKAWWTPVGWMENTGDLRNKKFNVHIIDRIRSPHSLGIGDLEGNGEMAVVGEHDPFKPYRCEARLYAYKKNDPQGLVWSRYPIDNRFSNHVGTKVVELTPGKLSVISHSWKEPAYVHLWERG